MNRSFATAGRRRITLRLERSFIASPTFRAGHAPNPRFPTGHYVERGSSSFVNRADAVAGRHLPLAVRQQHDLAEHSAFAEHLVRAARLFERQPLRDQRLDLALFQQVQQR